MEHVTAKQAADMTGQSERTIRRWIQSGRLRARKIAPNRYEIAVSDLPPRKRSPYADLRARIDTLEARIETLERANASRTRYDGNLTVYDSPRVVAPILPAKTAGATLTSTSSASFFPHHAAAAEWLTLHGVQSVGTPKSWHGWRNTSLTREAVLSFAIERCDVSNHRIQWRLHRCGDPACICVEMLG